MTMTRSKFFLALALTASLAANAGVISNLQAGKLSEAEIAPNETTLTISGQMNAADFAYIFDNLNALKTLNLTEVSIVAYSGNALPYTGLQSSPANTLPDYALTGLTSLSEITLPANLTSIGKGSLSGTGIKQLIVPETVSSIGDYAAMRCESLTSLTIPPSVKSIGTRAFAYCPTLKTVIMTAQLTTIPEGLFEACGGLRSLSLEDLTSCTEIGPWAVAECNGLKSLILPASSEVISKGATYGVSGIQTLTLPESLNYIGDNAMSAMSSLVEIDATRVSEIPALGENVWGRLNKSEISLVTPNSLTQDFRDADQWNEFKIISQKDWENSTETIASTIEKENFSISVADGKIILSSSKPLGKIAVFNVAGQRIVSASAGNNAEIAVDTWAPGIYLVATEAGAAKVRI